MVPAHSASEYAASGGLLGHELRIEILLALGSGLGSDVDRPKVVKMSYAELLDAVQARDSSRFNYHLDQLCGSLVMKRNGEYMLTPVGLLAIGTIIQTDHDQVRDLGQVDFDCPVCGGALVATYERGSVALNCPREGRGVNSRSRPSPPGTRMGESTQTTVATGFQ